MYRAGADVVVLFFGANDATVEGAPNYQVNGLILTHATHRQARHTPKSRTCDEEHEGS